MKNDKATPDRLKQLANDPQLATAFNEMKVGVCFRFLLFFVVGARKFMFRLRFRFALSVSWTRER